MRRLERVELARTDAMRAMAKPEVVRFEEKMARIEEGIAQSDEMARSNAVKNSGCEETSSNALATLPASPRCLLAYDLPTTATLYVEPIDFLTSCSP
jgi:hypothetical protein